MRGRAFCIAAYVLLLIMCMNTAPVQAVTVYFQDGTRIEVDEIVSVGDQLCLLVELSKIDTDRTLIPNLHTQELIQPANTSAAGLELEHVDFMPSQDDRDIIATGEVINSTDSAVQNVRVLVTLKDKDGRKLLAVQGHVKPKRLEPGRRGSYRLQVQKPQGFWKAGIDVQAEAVQ